MASGSESDIGDKISKASKKFHDTLNSNNLDEIKSMYTSDATLMPHGYESVIGNEAITEFYRSLKREGATHGKVSMVEWGAIGHDLLFERGTFTVYTKEGVPIDVGKYVTIWKEIDQELKAYIDIANSNSRNSSN
ncbi:hypothetical protein TrispH2_002189 [Trichoplax sp. H2]|uniref:DUF4440 domain-containing protein n=1 Tax=Trichoplax adhaerens TaxID=10228 RepID=B3RT32_TRIAD|nr:expressed hypothetical protein [Trichoplax adhaerens]EDV27159.1 expressed hypothetical protein [Trichoplax adhaerens]RDD45721.1 hypothetical protein TrispH2_002189 [Trichoplax sp. H2]|eukprot:XP_002111155.1 expressed hypothetical protein [Trichoplax adhaerens]